VPTESTSVPRLRFRSILTLDKVSSSSFLFLSSRALYQANIFPASSSPLQDSPTSPSAWLRLLSPSLTSPREREFLLVRLSLLVLSPFVRDRCSPLFSSPSSLPQDSPFPSETSSSLPELDSSTLFAETFRPFLDSPLDPVTT